MKHPSKLILLALSLFFLPVENLPLRAAEEKGKQPNILFIIADQWRAEAFGYTGDPNVKVPNIDRLASESVNFTHAVSNVPVCSPTRASIMTGQYAPTHGVFINDLPLSPDAVTIAKELRKAGYDTGAIGKWHIDGHGRLNFIPRERRQGFDYWKVLECTHDYNKSPYYADGPEKLMWEGYDAIAQTRDAEQFIRAHAKSEHPFFLYLSWGPPHNPYETAPAKYKAMYNPADLKLRPNVPENLTDTVRKQIAGYYAHCSALDDCMGDLRRTLKESGLDKNTIIVFTSDHGDMLGSHNGWRKQRPLDESIRVPMLMHVPGLEPKKLDAPISTVDLMPTLLSFCGVPVPKTVQGHDFSSYARSGKDAPVDAALIACVAVFGEWTPEQGGREYRGIRTTRYTYVRDLKGPWLLFDDEKDPYQEKNLVDLQEQKDLQAKLDAQLQAKLKEAHDEFLPGAENLRRHGFKPNPTGHGYIQETLPPKGPL